MFKRNAFLLAAFLSCRFASAAAPAQRPIEVHLSGPFTAGNLTVYLVHESNLPKSGKFFTLDQALKNKVIKVHEVGPAYVIDNASNVDVFLQAGEILKGSIQDRALGQDLIASAHTENLSVPIHCVEHGRSTPRSGGSATTFDGSPNILVSKTLKLANYADDQQQVWDQVAAMQLKLADSVQLAGGTVAPTASPTSLELTVEDKAINAAATKYEKELPIKAKDRTSDVVGFIFAINGKLNSGDVYGSSDLFDKMYPKLLHAAAVEAVAEQPPAYKRLEDLPSVASIESMVKAVDAQRPARSTVLSAGAKPAIESNYFRFQTPAAPEDPAKAATPVKVQTAQMAMYETPDPAGKAAFVHRAYLSK